MIPKVAKICADIRGHIKAVVAFFDPVAVRKTWITGECVELLSTVFRSPMEKSIAIENVRVADPHKKIAATIPQGTTRAASLTSSPG